MLLTSRNSLSRKTSTHPLLVSKKSLLKRARSPKRSLSPGRSRRFADFQPRPTQYPRRTPEPERTAQYHEFVVDIPAWRRKVISGGGQFVYPYPLFFFPENAGSLWVADHRPHEIVCGGIAYPLVRADDSWRKTTFLIIQFGVTLEGEPDQSWPHIVGVYASRKSTRGPWDVDVCDPNWNAPSADPDFPRRLGAALLKRGQEVSRFLNSGDVHLQAREARVTIRQCVGLHSCVPTNRGVCFAEMCLFLMIPVFLKETTTAGNGRELFRFLLDARRGAASLEADIVRNMFSMEYSRRGLGRQLVESGGQERARKRRRRSSK